MKSLGKDGVLSYVMVHTCERWTWFSVEDFSFKGTFFSHPDVIKYNWILVKSAAVVLHCVPCLFV